MAEVRLDKLTKKYGDNVAVDELTLHCQNSEFFFILGPSGAGKTSILKMIAGLTAVDGGSIYVGDTLVNDLEPGLRNVAMAFEAYALYPHLTVFENIAFPLRAPVRRRQFSESEVRARVQRIGELLRIDELLERMPTQLSGGQKQRVALGRALIREPEAFLLDEPIAHLDAKLRHHMRAELKSMQREFGTTAIYTTPDQLEALSMADTIAVINEGKLHQIGSPLDIYNRPADRFVARFVGDPPMNFLEKSCQVVSEEGETRLALDGLRVNVSPRIQDLIAQQARSRLQVGIRPSDISLSHADSGSGWQGEVYLVEQVGRSHIFTLNTNGDMLRVKTPLEFQAKVGETLHLSFNADKIYLFDEDTAQSI
jgi:ABC-type sugar transport system ATPase subunit